MVTVEIQQPPRVIKIYSDLSGGKWLANENDITQAAQHIAKDMLRQNNIELSESADKSLTLSLVEAVAEGTMVVKANVRMKVKAGENLVKEFHGYQNFSGSLYSLNWAVESATFHSVKLMFEDPEILKYLSD